jgi:hypothetical protein
MSDTPELTDVSRRRVLKAVGTGATVGVALTGTVSGSPSNNFGYVVDGSDLEGATVTLAGSAGRRKVRCDAGGSESRVKTEAWNLEESGETLYLIPSGYDAGDVVDVGEVFTSCTRNDEIEGEVSITKR